MLVRLQEANSEVLWSNYGSRFSSVTNLTYEYAKELI